MDRLYIVIPAYNEAENITAVIDDWYPIIEAHGGNGQSRLVVVNDGSRDDTGTILRECARKKPLLVALDKPNGGHGSAVLYGYRYAIAHGADFIFQTDSDGQTLPGEFGPFWDEREHCDAVIGNRTHRQDGFFRVVVEWVLRALLECVFGVRVPDANAPYRLMKASVVQKYMRYMPEDYNLPNAMLTTLFCYFGERVAFRPISFRPRQAGVNSINVRKIVKIGWKAVGDFIAIRVAAGKDREK